MTTFEAPRGTQDIFLIQDEIAKSIAETLLESIRSLAEAYPPETVVYSGHGPPTTLGAELARNPFLAELRA